MANLSGTAKIAGVIGWPVAHSLSPKLHQYWLNKHGIDGVYIPLPVRPEDCKEVIAALPKMGFRGVNLTLPHKELVLPLLASLDEAAAQAGMANTIVINESGLHGMNTDSYGFLENIRSCLPVRREHAVILGAGGAAKAVAYALRQAGFKRFTITNRTEERAVELAAQLGGTATAKPWDNRALHLENADLLVNATSLGMAGKDALYIDLSSLPKTALVTDIVYTPLITPLLAQAASRGNPTVDGLGMLLHQGVPGFEAWFGVRPEVTDELRAYMLLSSPSKEAEK